MTPCARSRRRWLIGCVALLATGCSSHPTYPKEHLTQSLQDLFNSEQLHASVRWIDHTLAVQLEAPGTLAQRGAQIGIGPVFDDITHKVLTDLHRVLLSSDAPVQFYVLLLSDPQVPGAYVTMVRYLDDVRRANASMLDTPEIFARTIFDLQMVGPNRPLTLEQYVPRDIRLEEFLSWQLARRIEHQLSQELQSSGMGTVGRCGGEFHNGEFAFTLNVAPRAEGPLDEATLRKIFQSSTGIIARVLSSYRFESFHSIRLTHPLTGRSLVLPKAHLELFR